MEHQTKCNCKLVSKWKFAIPQEMFHGDFQDKHNSKKKQLNLEDIINHDAYRPVQDPMLTSPIRWDEFLKAWSKTKIYL